MVEMIEHLRRALERRRVLNRALDDWHERKAREAAARQAMTPKQRKAWRAKRLRADFKAEHGVKRIPKPTPKRPPLRDVGRIVTLGLVRYTLDRYGRRWIITRDHMGRWIATASAIQFQGRMVEPRMRSDTSAGLRRSIRALGLSLRTWCRPLDI